MALTPKIDTTPRVRIPGFWGTPVTLFLVERTDNNMV